MGSWIRILKLRVRGLLKSREKESELDQEMEFHLQMLIDGNLELGMNPKEARAAALKEFGSVELHKEEVRDSWGMRTVMDTLRNLRFGLRLSYRYRGSSILALVVLSLGIGIATIMYTMSSKLMDTSAGADLDKRQLFVEWETSTEQGERISSIDFKMLRSEVDSLENLVGIEHRGFWFQLPRDPEGAKYFRGVKATPNLFDLADALPVRGRVFAGQDVESSYEPVILISNSIWTDFFGRSEAALGSTVIVDGHECRIIGVMPPGFAFPGNQQIWMPTEWNEFDAGARELAPEIDMVGRLKPGENIGRVRVELETLASNLSIEFPETNKERTRIRVTPYKDRFRDDDATAVLLLGLFGALLVLSLSCLNVFQIVMARTAIRSHELAVRCSLGARRSHVIWQVVVDGLTLAGIGALLGVGLAALGLHYISDVLRVFETPGIHQFQLQSGVVVFAVGAALFAGVASSIVPAWRASNINPYAVLKDDSKSSPGIYIGWLAKVMVVSQVAFSSILLFLSVILLQPGVLINIVKTPYDKDTVLAAKMDLRLDESVKTAQDIENFYAGVKEKLMAVPGVRAVALTSSTWGIMGDIVKFKIEGQESESFLKSNSTQVNMASPDYLDVFGLEPLSGRMISPLDTEDSLAVCVVDSRFVNRYFKREDPIGRRLKITQNDRTTDWITIVGVIPGIKPAIPGVSEDGMDNVLSEIVVPHRQSPDWVPSILLSAQQAGSPQYRKAMRESVKAIAPGAEFRGAILTIGERFDILSRLFESISTTSAIFGSVILAISIIGLYTVVAFTTAQRRKEFGIRIAVGCGGWGIVKSVIKPWSAMIGTGLILGGIASLALGMAYVALVANAGNVEIRTYEFVPIFCIVIVLICLASLIAMGIPTWRATKIEPMEVIRVE